jgi:hypothetical protein
LNRGNVGRFGAKVRADIQVIVEAASAVTCAVAGGGGGGVGGGGEWGCAVGGGGSASFNDVSSSDILNAIKGVKSRGVNTNASASDGLNSADVFWATKLSVDLRAFMFSKAAVGLSCEGVTSKEICDAFAERVGTSELKKKTFTEIVDAQTEIIDRRVNPLRRRLKVGPQSPALILPAFHSPTRSNGQLLSEV